jgi:hypothetical protein
MNEETPTVDRIDKLLEAAEQVATTNEELALAAVEYQERAKLARSRFRTTVIAITSTAALLLAGIFILFLKVNDSLASGKSVRNTLLDCVRPTGQCYQDGQKKTAGYLGDLNRVIILAAVCAQKTADRPLDEATQATQACVQSHFGG